MARGSCGLDAYEFGGAARREWPAIHRVLVAAMATATCGDMIRASMDEGQGSLMRELVEALRALDGGA